MTIWITLIMILAITALAALVRQISKINICPICVGVSCTWITLLTFSFFHFSIDLHVVSILMGGSIVGIAYTAEKLLPAHRSPLLWKSLFIPFGFVFVASIIDRTWGILGLSTAVLAGIGLWFFLPIINRNKKQNDRIVSIEEKMKNCC